jgi:hypothetical protein
VIGAARFIGGLGIIFLFLVIVLCLLHVFVAHRRMMAAIAGWSALAILMANAMPFGNAPREFRLLSSSSEDRAAGSKPETVEETLKRRQISSVAESFAQWLENRPSFKRADSAEGKYPVFIVAAQGGGQYAAYHTALVLARLYDQCPKLKDHVFAISSVSGGSVGAATISELLRTSGSLADSCDGAARNDGALERSVQHFFSHDFVTPVLVNGLSVRPPWPSGPAIAFNPRPGRRAGACVGACLGGSAGNAQNWRHEPQFLRGVVANSASPRIVHEHHGRELWTTDPGLGTLYGRAP